MANVTFYMSSSIPTTSKGTAGGLIVSTHNTPYTAGGIYYDNGSSILNLGMGVCVRTISTNATTASSTTDSTTIYHTNIRGVILRVEGVTVGSLLNGTWEPGTPTVTPGGGSNGACWKISCPWTYVAGKSGVTLMSYMYKIWYIPYN